MTGLLDDTATYWKGREVTIQTWLQDKRGRYAFVVHVQFGPDRDPERLLVTARDGMRTPLGIMGKVLKAARGRDAYVAVRTRDQGKRPVHYLFDPATCLRHGRWHTAEAERDADGERWVDCHPDWSVTLDDYIEGKTPPGPDADVTLDFGTDDGSAHDTGRTDLGDYT